MKGKKIFSAVLSLSLAAVLCLSGCTSAAADDSSVSSGVALSVPPAEEAVSAPAQTTVDIPTSDPLAPPEEPVYIIAQQHQPDLVRGGQSRRSTGRSPSQPRAQRPRPYPAPRCAP